MKKNLKNTKHLAHQKIIPLAIKLPIEKINFSKLNILNLIKIKINRNKITIKTKIKIIAMFFYIQLYIKIQIFKILSYPIKK